MVSELLKQRANIGLRVNPNVDQGGHEYIKTGRKDDKFGISFAEAKELVKTLLGENTALIKSHKTNKTSVFGSGFLPPSCLNDL